MKGVVRKQGMSTECSNCEKKWNLRSITCIHNADFKILIISKYLMVSTQSNRPP